MLSVESFASYPPQARQLAVTQLKILERLPVSLAALLLRELIGFDWKFPAERRELTRQFTFLAGLSEEQFRAEIAPFAALQIAPELETSDWVNQPAQFSEKLTAHLWATHQIEAFRTAATRYIEHSNPEPVRLPVHRASIVVIGQGAANSSYRLFRKLKAHGTYYNDVEAGADGMAAILRAAAQRAREHPEPYAHWYIDGGKPQPTDALTTVSYHALAPARAVLQAQMRKAYEAGQFDPEAFRSMLARTGPEKLGLAGDPTLDRFAVSLLTEGSGTQVFSTTFVQWAARETLRRAQPLTLVVRFAPRQKEGPMGELLSESQRTPVLDPQGSLIDADNGAYYTWLNQQRLSEPGNATFLVWLEDQRQALVIHGKPQPSKPQPGKPTLAGLVESVLTAG